MKKLMTALLTAMLLITNTAYADKLHDGMIAYGKGNYKEAITLFKPLALQGDVDAQTNLGVMYANGQGVPQHDVEAVKWYKLAAEQGYAMAQFNLGSMYYIGLGVTQDYIKAYMWNNLAAAQGDAHAVENRNIVASKMSQQQLAKAQNLSRECLARKYKGC